MHLRITEKVWGEGMFKGESKKGQKSKVSDSCQSDTSSFEGAFDVATVSMYSWFDDVIKCLSL